MKIVKIILISFFFTVTFIVIFPQVFFFHKATHKNFVIYSTQSIPKTIHQLLDSVNKNLQSSTLYKEDINQKIFICNNHLLYSILCYPSRNTFGGNWELWGKIFIASADINTNTAFRKMDYRTRTLVNVITHETMHSLIENNLGYQKYKKLPKWKNEGYCDYIAQGSTLTHEEGMKNLCIESNTKSYFPYYLTIKYLTEDRKKTIEEIFIYEFNYNDLLDTLKRKHCSH